mgnify:CR=1 FL=1
MRYRFADIILPIPFDTFTYHIPTKMECLSEGVRVVVPFGKSKTYVGVVLRLHNDRPENVVIKDIISLMDPTPIVNSHQFDFWKWISSYYMCPLGDVYKAAYPAGMKKEGDEVKRRRKNIVEKYADSEGSVPNALSEHQQTAYNQILESWKAHDITLLHGVTSSGKTEVYTHLISRALESGQQVLYLLPEIALTTQITDRLRAVFGNRMGVYHSRFSDTDRVAVYQKQLSDSPYGLILGVRSSVFLPFHNLGLVIVDEEHESSFKQQDPAPRYNARSAAIMLARQYGAKTLLGTATPSIEVYKLCKDGKYGYVQMTRRYSGVELPDIEVVDIKRLKFQKRMIGSFSPVLVDAIKESLSHNGQVILFQNRRGFSSFIECKQCGWVPRCEHCDVSLTYHKKTNTLTCHYCGNSYTLPRQCPCCETLNFVTIGLGTERIEEQVNRLFPEARVSRMDLDTTRSANAYQKIINAFSSHENDILIGTQMVTKGLDFDSVNVVGILDADTMLNMPDFRSYERTFQMLSQVAGRSGRKGKKGKVILQTRSADSPLIKDVVTNDYEDMYRLQVGERELFGYPPFTRLIYIYMKHRDDDTLTHLSDEMAQMLRRVFGVRVLGPDKPLVGRVQSMFIRKIMLKIYPNDSVSRVREALNAISSTLLSKPVANALKVYFDVDPLD